MFRFHGTQSERDRLKTSVRNDELKFDLCVTTYEAYVAEDTWFKSRRWFYCVLDEGHRIKNSETNLSGKLRGIGSLYRLSKMFRLRCLAISQACSASPHWHACPKQSGRAMGALELAIPNYIHCSFRAVVPRII
jgi:hypothetical protein